MLLCFIKLLKFEICLKIRKILKQFQNFFKKVNEWILSKIVKVLNSLSILYCK